MLGDDNVQRKEHCECYGKKFSKTGVLYRIMNINEAMFEWFEFSTTFLICQIHQSFILPNILTIHYMVRVRQCCGLLLSASEGQANEHHNIMLCLQL